MTFRHVLSLILPVGIVCCLVGCADPVDVTGPLEAKGVSFSRSLKDEIQTVRFDRHQPSDAEFQTVSGLASLTQLYADAPAVTDAGISGLSTLSKLEIVCLQNCGVSGKGMAALAALPALKHLELSAASQLDDAAVGALKGHATLEILDLSQCNLTDACLDAILSIPRLTELRLIGTKISDKGLEKLALAKQLTHLAVGSELITDSCVAAVAQLSELRHLEIIGSQLTDQSMPTLAGLQKLELLKLNGNRALTDQGICQLGALPLLTNLGISETAFTGAGCGSAGFPQLLGLDANGTNVTNANIREFAGMKHLSSLKLLGTTVTEDAVRKVFPTNHQTSVAFGALE